MHDSDVATVLMRAFEMIYIYIYIYKRTRRTMTSRCTAAQMGNCRSFERRGGLVEQHDRSRELYRADGADHFGLWRYFSD